MDTPYKVASKELDSLNIIYTNVPVLLFKLSKDSRTLIVTCEDYCRIITHPAFVKHYLAHASVSNNDKSFVWQGIKVTCEDADIRLAATTAEHIKLG